jgi:hypothetical protein
MIADRLSLPRARATSAAVLLALAAVTGAGCGKEIGDSCVSGVDCGGEGDRICELASLDGYCTIPGCDYGTCPEEAVCIRFYNASFENLPCTPATEDVAGPGGTNDCGLDEACALAGQCVPASSEVRYCMKSCSSNGDCRDGYECRDEVLMKSHGGEPVPPSGERLASFDRFCAQAPL